MCKANELINSNWKKPLNLNFSNDLTCHVMVKIIRHVKNQERLGNPANFMTKTLEDCTFLVLFRPGQPAGHPVV